MSEREGSPERFWVWGVAAALVGVLLGYAWRLRFLCDDAFISFRYAENLIAGQGLVFNAGERVEGYTNFLWTLQIAALWGLTGVDPGSIAMFLGFLSTVAMLAVFAGLARTSPWGRDPALLLGLLLLATHRSIAVWTTSGLEQRQFTLWMLLAIALTYGARQRLGFYLAASVALGLAELSRPEVLLYAGCLAGWVALTGWLEGVRPVQLARAVGALLGPFVLVLVLHVGFRMAYYGYPLPNTFYAKGTEVWLEAGVTYLTGAAVEHGLILLLPLGILGLVGRSARGDHLHLLSAMLITPHLAYLARIGGDHFEYRMLDLAFVLLALAVADGVLWIAQRSRVAAGGLTVAALFYANLIPLLHLRAVDGQEAERQYALQVPLSPEAGGLAWVPGVVQLLRWHDATRAWEAPRLIATRRVEHHSFWLSQTERWTPYRSLPRGTFPPKLAMMEGAMGILPFCLRGVTVVDAFGLTDATVARMDAEPDSDRRRLAHPRRVGTQIEPYLNSRVNVRILPPEATLKAALASGPLAIELAPDLWMPFELVRGATLESLELEQEVFTRTASQKGATLVVRGRRYEVLRWIDDFDRGLEGWTATGPFEQAFAPGRRGTQQSIRGFEGRFVNSYHPDDADRPMGTMRRDAPVDAQPGDVLGLLVGGGELDVGVQIEHPDGSTELVVGARSERLVFRTVPLRGPTTLSIVDRNPGSWGHVLVDSIVLLRDAGPVH